MPSLGLLRFRLCIGELLAGTVSIPLLSLDEVSRRFVSVRELHIGETERLTAMGAPAAVDVALVFVGVQQGAKLPVASILTMIDSFDLRGSSARWVRVCLPRARPSSTP